MSYDPEDSFMAEWETEERDWEKRNDEIVAAQQEWKANWPNHCRKCGGWGGWSYRATGLSYSSGGEPGGFDLCGALPEGVCHRCGGAMTGDEGPCESCGWNFGEDGMPEL